MRNRCVYQGYEKTGISKTGFGFHPKLRMTVYQKNLPEAGRGLSPLSHFLATRETSVSRAAENSQDSLRAFYPHPQIFYFVGGEGGGEQHVVFSVMIRGNGEEI